MRWLITLLIGINDLWYKPQPDAGGAAARVAHITQRLRQLSPQSQIVHLAILPTAGHAANHNPLITQVNSAVAGTLASCLRPQGDCACEKSAAGALTGSLRLPKAASEGTGSTVGASRFGGNGEKAIALPQPGVTSLDLTGRFLDATGQAGIGLLPDGVHLAESGYEIVASSLISFLPKLTGAIRTVNRCRRYHK